MFFLKRFKEASTYAVLQRQSFMKIISLQMWEFAHQATTTKLDQHRIPLIFVNVWGIHVRPCDALEIR